MLIVKVEKNNIERALKEYKSKVIKSKQLSELTDRKVYVKKSIERRNIVSKAEFKQRRSSQDF